MPADDSRFIRFKIMWRTTFFEVTANYAFDTTNQKKVAIKKIENAFQDAIQAKNVLREVLLLRHMNHRNVVAMVDIIPPPRRDLFSDVYIASDLILTDMHKVIHSDPAVSADRRKSYMFQLLCGLKYLHTKHVLHRDLKPSNLLLTADDILKICDFGQARTISRKYLQMTKRVGTLHYKAPEILLHSAEYNEAVDVWSAGCIFAELILGRTLLPGVNEEDQLSKTFELIGTPPPDADMSFLDSTARREVRGYPHQPRRSFAEIFTNVDLSTLDLVQKMLIFDPRQRITVEEAISHSCFHGLVDPSNQQIGPAPSFEEQTLSIEDMKDLIYEESLVFNPDFRATAFSRS